MKFIYFSCVLIIIISYSYLLGIRPKNYIIIKQHSEIDNLQNKVFYVKTVVRYMECNSFYRETLLYLDVYCNEDVLEKEKINQMDSAIKIKKLYDKRLYEIRKNKHLLN